MLNAELPTDSVYKFLTVLGMFIIFGAGYIVVNIEQTHSTQMYDALFQQVQVDRQFAEAVSKAKNCDEALAFLRDAKANSDRLLSALPILLNSGKNLELTRRYIPWVFAFGAVTFGSGLYLWITRTQQYMDRLLKKGKS